MDAAGTQAPDPSAQKPGGLLTPWKNAAARPDVGLHSEISRPRPQFRWAKIAEQTAPAFRLTPVPRREIFHRFAVGKIEAASTRHQEFAANGTLRIANDDLCAGSPGGFG